jgi:hypothetical protein
LGLGANVEGIRFLVIDALAFRSISSFTPGEVTPAEFARAQAEERLALIMQNIGRALRGEAGKTVVLIAINADEPLRTAIKSSPAIIEGSDLLPVIVSGTNLPMLVDQAGRWLKAGGGEWPEPDQTKATKRKGRPKRTKESVLAAAEVAIKDGIKWRDFAQKQNVRRVLTPEETESLRAQFGSDQESTEPNP